MFQAGFHIKNHHIFSSQHQIVNNTFQHYMLRTYTSAAACLDSSQDKEPYAVADLTVFIRNIVYLWVQMIELISCSCSCTFLHKLTHFGDRHDRIQCFFIKSQRQAKICIRIHICCKYRSALCCIQPRERCCKSSFAYAAFSCNCYFHFMSSTFYYNFRLQQIRFLMLFSFLQFFRSSDQLISRYQFLLCKQHLSIFLFLL